MFERSEVAKALDALFSRKYAQAPGLSVGIAQEDGEPLIRSYGLANLQHGVLIASDTKFRIASLTKQMVSVAALLLSHEGKLNIDGQIGVHFPWLRAGGNATIRQLLTMTSGIRDTLELARLIGITTRYIGMHNELLPLLERQTTLNFQPGERYIYSNINYGLVGTLLEDVSGRPLNELMADLLFTPLGMNDTSIQANNAAVVPRLATGYVPSKGLFFETPELSFGISAAGFGVSTIADLLKWSKLYFMDRFQDVPVASELATCGYLNDGTRLDYGLGVEVRKYRGLKVLSHTGSLSGYRALLIVCSRPKLTIALLGNREDVDYKSLFHVLMDTVLGDALSEGPPKFCTRNDSASDLVGEWFDANSGELLTVSVGENGLVEASILGNKFLLQDDGPTRWRYDYAHFPIHAELKSETLAVNFGGAHYVFQRPPRTQVIDLASYAGIYKNEDLGIFHEVRAVDGTLVVTQGPAFFDCKPIVLEPLAEGVFTFDGSRLGGSYLGSMRFTRKDGKVEGFSLATDRLKNLEFARLSH